MKIGKKLPLTDNQWHKHNYIRTFFSVNLKELEGLYKRLNDSLDLTPEKWRRFVNSKELFERVLEITNKHYGPNSELGMYEGFR